MVRKTLFVVGLVGMLLTAMTGAAFGTTPVGVTLSSFEPTATDGVIDGGIRTISVTNTTEATLTGHTVDLGQAPCDCVVVATIDGVGTLVDGTWQVGDIAPGETVEISFLYGQPTPTTATTTGVGVGVGPFLLLLVGAGVVLTAGTVWRLRQPAPTHS